MGALAVGEIRGLRPEARRGAPSKAVAQAYDLERDFLAGLPRMLDDGRDADPARDRRAPRRPPSRPPGARCCWRWTIAAPSCCCAPCAITRPTWHATRRPRCWNDEAVSARISGSPATTACGSSSPASPTRIAPGAMAGHGGAGTRLHRRRAPLAGGGRAGTGRERGAGAARRRRASPGRRPSDRPRAADLAGPGRWPCAGRARRRSLTAGLITINRAVATGAQLDHRQARM